MPKLKVKGKKVRKKRKSTNIHATDLAIEYVDLADLKPFPGNPRKHSENAIKKLVRSIEAVGWTNPILVSTDGFVVAGHARMKAAEVSGIKSVPIVRLPLSGTDAQLYVVADNKLQDLTEWDWPKLGDLFQELDNGEIDLTYSGFDLDEIGNILSGMDEASGQKTEWEGLPEYISDDLTAYRSIIIHFANEEGIKKFAKLIKQNITNKTKYLHYPKCKRENFSDKIYDEA